MTINAPVIRAPRGSQLRCKGWQQEAALRCLMNNLDPEVAERPADLVVYGGNGKAARNWECYHAIIHELEQLGSEETLLVQSGKPVAVFPTHDLAPRVLIANSNLVGKWANWENFHELDRKGLMMYGQMTAGSWIYIGTQGILQGTFQTFASLAEKHYEGSLKGKLVVTGGVGGMGGAQPLSVTLNGGVVLAIDVDRSRIERRVAMRYCDLITEDLDEALKLCEAAKRECRSLSVGLVGNCADVLPELVRRGVEVDVVTDQTSAHDPLNGYVPQRLSLSEAAELRRSEDPVRRLVIAGGGNIGLQLARTLEKSNQVKLIERDPRRARRISEILENTIVLNGDAADEELLVEENIDSADVFAALTNSEEANVLSAMLAKRLGARRVMALINRPSYGELMENHSIDIVISPQTITIGSLLAHVRRGDVVRVHSLRRGAAEAIEAVVHGTQSRSRLIGHQLEQIKLPQGASIVAIVRGERVIMAHHDTTIEAEDHVIIFLADRRHIDAVSRLFQSDT